MYVPINSIAKSLIRLSTLIHSGKRLALAALLCGMLLMGDVSAQEAQAIQPPQEPAAESEPKAVTMSIGNPLVYQAFQPCRMVDTRNAVDPFGGPKLVAGGTRAFDLVPGAGSCPSDIPVRVRAIVINVTITETEGSGGFLTIYPTGGALPNASVINWDKPSATVANEIIVPVSAVGSISVFSSAGTHVILDVSGYFLSTLENGDSLTLFGNVGTNNALVAAYNTSVAASASAVIGEIASTAPGSSSAGVRGSNAGTGNLGYGVYGTHAGAGTGVFGSAGEGGEGVLGFAPPSGAAGRFFGNVTVSGNMSVSGTLTKGSGTFRIDHPLDPTNKYLSHSFVESPDMMNIYNGNVTLDAKGRAVVTMPAYFDALNREFRYQLTAIGAPANLYVAQEITGNRFKIAGGKAGLKVSWMVTGIRHDAYAAAHPIKVEEAKPLKERGTYLHPEAFGQPVEKGVEHARRPELLQGTGATTKQVAATKQ
ncbi:MAG: hypothetical protein H0T45_11300 [Pyrinomonadaceae bacterium]|nr:hypothetical protein [Pyrinomonadaceae bacterium]